MDDRTRLYDSRDLVALGAYYTRHAAALTREGLHDKSEIAAELAWRDQRIAELASLLSSFSATLDIEDGWVAPRGDSKDRFFVLAEAEAQHWQKLVAQAIGQEFRRDCGT